MNPSAAMTWSHATTVSVPSLACRVTFCSTSAVASPCSATTSVSVWIAVGPLRTRSSVAA